MLWLLIFFIFVILTPVFFWNPQTPDMQTRFSKIFVAACLIVLTGTQLSNASEHSPSQTFANKDIFQEAAFLKNEGIVNDFNGTPVLYYATNDHIAAFFTAKGVVYRLHNITVLSEKEEKEEREKEKKHKGLAEKDEDEKHISIGTSVVSMEWKDANPNVELITGNQLPGNYTYFKKDGGKGQTLTTHGFEKITYKDIYPGIDVEYTFPAKGGLEYNLVVRPGANPQKVQMVWSGMKKLEQDAEGNIIVKTKCGSLVEHAPVTYDENKRLVNSGFIKNGHTTGFNFPDGYNSKSALVIDPWVTAISSLPPVNAGFDADYDFLGNLFVYGAGSIDEFDLTNFFKIAKYDAGGSHLWTFNGQVTSIGWSTADIPDAIVAIGNFIVDKVTGKTYIGKPDLSGTTVVRIDANGAYDNFVSTVDPFFQETWGFAYNCTDGSVLALGGGTNSDLNMGVINTTTGATTTTNITGITFDEYQDILTATYDSAGSLYVIMNGSFSLPYTNTMYKVNSGFNGYTWAANTNFFSFSEVFNAPYWGQGTLSGNWYNGFAANGSYLYYYDGENVAAYSLATGNSVGNTYNISNYNTLYQGGIAVDNCNHVYVGGIGVIKTFTFDGLNFNPGADISLGAAYANDTVHDVRYNKNNNLLYVAASGIVGTYNASLSGACNVFNYTVSTSQTCTSATVNVSPSAGLNPLVFTYIWSDPSGNILNQTTASSNLSNTLSGIGDGTYIVQVQWNTNCGGSAVLDTVIINCSTTTLTHSPDTTICPNQPVTLTATASTTGGTYSWSPAGATTSSITVTPATTTTYTVTYTPTTGAPLTASITVTVATNPVSVTVNNVNLCAGGNATLTATPSVGGGTYLWSPGGATTNPITVSPASTTTYTVTYSTNCGSATGTGTVTVNPNPTIALSSYSAPCGGGGVIYATGNAGTAPYQYAINGGTYQQADSFTSLASALYTVQLQDAAGCTASDTISVNSTSGVTLVLRAYSPSCGNGTGYIVATATGNNSPFQYSLNGGAYQASDSFGNVSLGLYTVDVKDATGCTASDTISVAQGNPVAVILVADSVRCFGARDGKIFAQANGGRPTYQFALNGGAYQLADSFTVAIGNYTVSVQDADGCTASANVDVYQPSALQVDSVVTTAVKCPGDKNGTLKVYASGGTAPYNYSCTKDGANFFHVTNDVIEGLDTGSYIVILSDNNGCTLTDNAYVPDAIRDTYLLTSDSTTCFGPQYNDGAVHATGRPAVNAPFQYSIDSVNFQYSGDFFGLTAGLYYITFKDANGCEATLPVPVYQPDKATLNILPSDTLLQLGQSIQLQSLFGPFALSTIVSYNWTPSEGLSCIDCPNPVASNYYYDNSFTLTVIYNNHCTVDASARVRVEGKPEVYIPNSFSPNGDGNNDVFLIYGPAIKTINLKIFNRWGEEVFESNNPYLGWDGTYKGVLQNPAVFVYEANITFLDDRKIFRTGSVTIIR